MNWNEIKEKYPKAINVFIEWRMRNNAFKFLEKRFCVTQYGFAIECLIKRAGFQGKDIESWVCYDRHQDDDGNRFLYDFFDKQGIYISIIRNLGDNDFFYHVDIEKRIVKDGDYFSTRTKAEEAAFLKVFEILESKLK